VQKRLIKLDSRTNSSHGILDFFKIGLVLLSALSEDFGDLPGVWLFKEGGWMWIVTILSGGALEIHHFITLFPS